MPRFIVSLETHASEDVEVHTDTPEDAVRAALALVGDGGVQRRPLRWRATSLEGEEVLLEVAGTCEACCGPLFRDENGERAGHPWWENEHVSVHSAPCPNPKAGA